MRSSGFGACVVVALAMTFMACSEERKSADVAEAGSVGFALSLPMGAGVDTVNYTLTGPNSYSKTGSFSVAGSDATFTYALPGIPAGAGYRIALTATSSDDRPCVSESGTFTVIARQSVSVAVVLSCEGLSTRGSIIINGMVNVCPIVDSAVATPGSAPVGDSISLRGQGFDEDAGPSALSYAWTASGAVGSIANADSANATFTCTSVGSSTVTLTISDGDSQCVGNKLSVDVTCNGAGQVAGSAAVAGTGGQTGTSGVGGVAGSTGVGGTSASGAGSSGASGAGGVAGSDSGAGAGGSVPPAGGAGASGSNAPVAGAGGVGGSTAGAGGGPVAGSGGPVASCGPTPPSFEAHSLGDPHLITFDGVRYDVQGMGEYTLVLDNTDGLEVQARTRRVSGRFVSFNAGVAVRVGSDRVSFFLSGALRPRLNGTATEFTAAETTLPGGGKVYKCAATIVVAWPDNSQVSLTGVGSGGHIDIHVYLSSARAARAVGLLATTSPSGTLRTRTGASVTSPATFQAFYQTYVSSWRVRQNTSLFFYANGENADSFADANIPTGLAALTAAQLQAGMTACASVPTAWRDSCVVDVGSTDDQSYVSSFANLPTPTGTFQVVQAAP